MEEQIAITKIDPNPYQPREKEDPEHIQKLAISIADDGLLQTPVGRRVGDRVQLAFGHSRLAAYKLLDDIGYKLSIHQTFEFEDGSPMAQLIAAVDIALDNGTLFSRMPVQVRDLADEEMFRFGVSENVARKDLTPIEEAKAMLRYRDEFKKTSAEIGELFGVKESTVRGKLRLLQLPAGIQAELSGASELVLRELCTWFELPEEVRNGATRAFSGGSTTIIQMAQRGQTAEQIHESIGQIVRYTCKDLARAPWKFGREFTHPDVVGLCKGCPHLLARDKANWCMRPGCYEAKDNLYKQEYLQEASETSGVPVAEPVEGGRVDKYVYATSHDFGWGGKEELATALQAKCENLRLVYDESHYAADTDPRRVKGYPSALIICKKRQGFCICSTAVRADVAIVERPAAQPEADDEERNGEQPEPKPTLTMADLKEIARETRAQKKRNFEAVHNIVGMASLKIYQGLVDQNPAVWRMLLHHLDWSGESKVSESHVVDRVAEYLASRIYDTDRTDPTPRKALDAFNAELKKAGLPALDWQIDSDPEEERPEPKTLAEVFEEVPHSLPGQLPDETLADYFQRVEQVSQE